MKPPHQLSVCLPVWCAGVLVAGWLAVGPCQGAPPAASGIPFPLIERFESFSVADGLPAAKVHCVLAAPDGRVWIGTANGLAVRENGRIRALGPDQAPGHAIVLGLSLDPATGNLWIATMRGLYRWSAGQLTSYTQTDSGLPNNVVYGVAVWRNVVWAATAAGLGALDLKTGSWRLFDHTNTIMHEPWVYAVTPGADRLFVGVWAGGVVEYDPAHHAWKAYRDPDGEAEMELVADSGPISDITSSCSWSDGVLWQATYFGLSRYDGSRWKTYVQAKTPLPSNFINSVSARGAVVWVCSDRGLSTTDGRTWATYRHDEDGHAIVAIARPGRPSETRVMPTGLPNDFVLSVSVTDHDVWIGTSHGLAHGRLVDPPKPLSKTLTQASERNKP
jgi:ligand-binding sensor domain-containing protein